MKYLLFFALAVLFSSKLFAQNIPVGDNYLEELARTRQVLGISDNQSSFSIRPVTAGSDSVVQNLLAGHNLVPNLKIFSAKSSIQLLPFSWLNEYNLNYPYGYNDAPLFPNKGFQTMVSSGLLFKSGFLIIQVKPEFVYAQNRDFKTFADVEGGTNQPQLFKAYFGIINGIDAPERFGTAPLTKAYAGQSKITIHVKGVEFGVSSENIWWGPGVQNSIMMSNSAPGFLHWTLNSFAPLKTAIGSFEWQIIGGNLKQSGYLPTDTNKLIYAHGLYIPKPKVTRYISAFSVNWHPKWLEGLFLGITEYDYMNKDSAYQSKNIFRKMIPVLTGSSEQANTITNTSDGDGQDFAFALNVRQLLPKYNAEIYFEWARNDRFGSLNDFIEEPEHSSAYTVGGRRLFEIADNEFIQVKMELTHLQDPPTYLLRPEPTWYVHLQAPQDGYTNDGRYLGAGIGPGSNSLMTDISFVKDTYSSYGITLERLVHDNDLYYNAFAGTDVDNRHWVDLCSTFYANLKIKNYQLSGEITPVYSLNYEYGNSNTFNLHSRINLTYYFN